MNHLLLESLRCSNSSRPPVWLMRQAGRYLPEYRALRSKYSLWEMFHNPEIATEVTLLPLQILDVDAAILFSDILVIAEAFGLKLHFPEKGGPVIEPLLKGSKEVDALPLFPVDQVLHYVQETIHLLKPHLQVPLIGFCGGPFTIASYCTVDVKNWLENDPESFHRLLQKITEASVAYLKMQIQAGVQAIQIFDSWADSLNDAQFLEFSLTYLKQIVDALKGSSIPVILFCRGSSLRAKEISALNPSCISFDWHREMSDLRKDLPSHIAMQGNIHPEFLLHSNPAEISKSVKQLLESMRGDPGFIVNLGHGVLPKTPVENVKSLVDTVKGLPF